MNWPHLHLVLVHLPIVGVPLGLGLLLAGAWRRSRELRGAGLVTLVLFAAIGLFVFASGKRAEDVVEHDVAVESIRLESHEEAAQVARIALIVLGLSALTVLALGREHPAQPWLVGGVAVFALVTALLVFRTANRGGEIRHHEIRPPAAIAAPPTG